jgi:hypothetical protein
MVRACVEVFIRATTDRSCGFLRMHAVARASIVPGMRRSTYAVWWQEDTGPRHAGKLELGSLHLLLSGNGSGRVAVPLDEIVEVEYHRGELSIERREGGVLHIGNLDGPGVLLELTDALAA